MVQAWYMDNEKTNPSIEHHLNPPKYVNLNEIYSKSGVEYFQINADSPETDEQLQAIKKIRGYSFEDEITCAENCMPNLQEKIKIFFQEHLHTDEEIRLVLDGSGYFDVRDKDDKWIRILVVKGDMLIIPAGIYHRFTLDQNMYIKAKRFFVGVPIWLPYNRPADEMDCRKEYLGKLSTGFSVKL